MKKQQGSFEQVAEKPCRDAATVSCTIFLSPEKKGQGFEEQGMEKPCRDAETVSYYSLITR